MYKVRTFIGPGMTGNLASVWIDGAPDQKPDPGETYCTVRDWQPVHGARPVSAPTPRAAVTCAGYNGSIRFCGHGLLACAAVLLQPSGTPAQPGRAPLSGIVLTTAEREITARRRGQRLWLTLPRLRSTPCAIPEYARRCFNWQPMRAAMAGGPCDYLILEWPWSTPLRGLVVDEDRLARHTPRAVIATQQDRGPHYHYRLRYFAPQYGISEDAVTGSAHAVAADYWQQRHPGRSRYFGLQASAAGGRVLSHVDQHWVSIGGDVDILHSAPGERA